MNAVKSCAPTRAAAFSASAGRSSGLGCQSARRASKADAVAVRASPRVEARVERVRYVLCREHAEVVRQQPVQRLCSAIRRRPGLHLDGGDVPERVHAGVGATRDCKRVDAPVELGEHLPELGFDGPRAGLTRPAAEPGAVVLDR